MDEKTARSFIEALRGTIDRLPSGDVRLTFGFDHRATILDNWTEAVICAYERKRYTNLMPDALKLLPMGFRIDNCMQ